VWRFGRGSGYNRILGYEPGEMFEEGTDQEDLLLRGQKNL
jgi:hypothetical protein